MTFDVFHILILVRPEDLTIPYSLNVQYCDPQPDNAEDNCHGRTDSFDAIAIKNIADLN
jgi:hypothetical protein